MCKNNVNKENNCIWNAAIYVRLSREDNDSGESNSIKNQKDLIINYIKSFCDVSITEVYSDDGYSGFTFERPAFEKMMKDVQNGLINCIIVKDLSRFGRNWTETGRYLDKILPSLKVRFIAINNHVDTIKKMTGSEHMIIPFTNLMNEGYIRDISEKTTSHLRGKCKDGQFIGAFAPFGYKKDILNHNKLVIDKVAAEVVKNIFRMKVEGMSPTLIAVTLNRQNILSPLEYRKNNMENYFTPFKTNQHSLWTGVAVSRILKNEVYIGVLEQIKTKKINFKIPKRIVTDKSERIRTEQSHEPIISLDTFNLVNELMQKDLRKSPIKNSLFPFSGLLYCSDCGSSMIRKTVASKGNKYFYYICSENKTNKNLCSSHSISETDLHKAVLCALQNHIASIIELEKIMDVIDTIPMRQLDIARLQDRLDKNTNEIEKLNGRLTKLYEDYLDKFINSDEYKNFSCHFHNRIAKCNHDIKLLKKEIEIISNDKEETDWIKLFKNHKNIMKIDRVTAIELIDKIIVYEKGKLEVYFKYQYNLDSISHYSNYEESKGCLNG